MSETTLTKNERILSIDRFRGFCIFTMVAQFWFGAFESTFESWALLFEHGEDGFQLLPGIAFADLFAPAFMFIIGMTMGRSFLSKEAKFGQNQASFKMILRYLGITGVGAVLSGLDKFIGIYGKYTDIENHTFADFTALFNKQNTNVKVFIICCFITLLLLLIMLILKLAKSSKGHSLMSSVLNYYLAAVGIVMIYSIFAWTGDLFFTHFASPGTAKTFVPFGTKIWDTLQNIGLAGLIALPFVKMRKESKLCVVGFIIFVMTVLCNHADMELISEALEGGIFGAPDWACIILLGSIFFDFHNEKSKGYWYLTAALLVFSIIGVLAFKFPAVKRGCSPAYVAFTAAIASLLFKLFTLFDNYKPSFNFFSVWGGNGLVLYVINFSLSLIAGAIIEAAEFDPGKVLGILIILVIMAIYSLILTPLQKKDKHIRM